MAIFWGVFWGAVLGTFWPGSGDLGMYVGGILGLFAGLTLRFVINKQVTESNAALRKQLLAQMAAASMSPATPLPTPAATAQPAKPAMPLAATGTATTSVAANTPATAQTALAEAAEDKAFWQDELKRTTASSARPDAQALPAGAVARSLQSTCNIRSAQSTT
jgi:hypothetical protein